MQPLIGLTCSSDTFGEERPPFYRLNHAYVNAVTQAGGVPILIPSVGDGEVLRALYDLVDAILLPGGGDIQPALYGALPHPTLDYVDQRLDETELAVARWALAEEKPVFGICRGQQTLNVAAGGTLMQDIPSELPGALVHRFEPRYALAHPIEVEPDSRLADVFGATSLEVNSVHHQAVAEVAPGFVVTARSPDGVAEGIEYPNHPFAVAVQFHPEELVPGHAACERLFSRFIVAARTAAARKPRH